MHILQRMAGLTCHGPNNIVAYIKQFWHISWRAVLYYLKYKQTLIVYNDVPGDNQR